MILRITQAFGELRCLCTVTREKLNEQVLYVRHVPFDWLVIVVSVRWQTYKLMLFGIEA